MTGSESNSANRKLPSQIEIPIKESIKPFLQPLNIEIATTTIRIRSI
jgi:hypothetical protein